MAKCEMRDITGVIISDCFFESITQIIKTCLKGLEHDLVLDTHIDLKRASFVV